MLNVDLLVWFVSSSSPLWPPERVLSAKKDILVVGAKADTCGLDERSMLESNCRSRGLEFFSWVSAETGEGIDNLLEALSGGQRDDVRSEVVVVERRHVDLLSKAVNLLSMMLEKSEFSLPLDIRTADLEQATSYLGAIIGRDVDASTLEHVFQDFCIGK